MTSHFQNDMTLPTFEEAMQLHRRAAANLDHVCSKIRNVSTKPSLSAIYSSDYDVECAPREFNRSMLLQNFNDIAHANFVAHPDLPITLNSLIFYYGIDTCHTWNQNLNQSRLNLIFASLTWASELAGVKYDQRFDASKHIWYSFVLAWVESLTPNGKFAQRANFLKDWSSSKFDLTWFFKSEKVQTRQLLQELVANVEPLDGNLMEWLHACGNGSVSEKEFQRAGPAMTVRFIMAQELQAKADKKMKEGLEKAQQVMFDAADAMTLDEGVQDETEVHTGDEEGGGEEHVAEEEQMNIDADFPPIPPKIDLARVNWASSTMQALLNIDKTIPWTPRDRPKSYQRPWIRIEQAYAALLTNDDTLADDIKARLNLSPE
ncbi:hypothetical protein BDU57DRAFT_537267 [Ampelomyces quisqualis]|uniref:Uncharacterized protein n=1 Tax=Ampelomyces quisqualis TaxID=50730 RepID=A0A6A5QS04_AMPQU|nr:hypothetical protein BDU57DRAFT_537267 [Ampelomyces quisqualis]